jgi:hypothetical protein
MQAALFARHDARANAAVRAAAVVHQSMGVVAQGYVARVYRRRAGVHVSRESGQQPSDDLPGTDFLFIGAVYLLLRSLLQYAATRLLTGPAWAGQMFTTRNRRSGRRQSLEGRRS